MITMSKFRKYLLVLIDAGVLGLACLTAFVITGLLTADNPEIFASSPIFLLFIVCCIPSMAALGVYRTIWRYAVAKDFLNLAGSLAAGGAVCAFILMILNRPVSGTMFLFTFMLAFFLVPVLVTRYVSLGSLLAYAVFFIQMVIFGQLGWFDMAKGAVYELCVITFLLTALAWYRHRANIKRLLNGTENKFGSKK